MKKIINPLFAFLILLMIINPSFAFTSAEGIPDQPTVLREFRGAWVATVANINWPSTKYLSVEEQKKEAINILDRLHQNHFNAVIFQARPQCDALYKSELEPWSYYLTGNQGVAPEPFYDPLEFWVEETHKRGMELHVWLNPYRAHHIEGGDVSDYSIVKKHPDWVLKLKSGYWWLDPSKKEAQDHSFNVVMDITKRYDIDGIHFDDYFYPYPSYNDNEDFPDDQSWKEYKDNNGNLSRSDWRRDNINQFIKRVYNGIKDIKPTVKFGLSPFGIWRPRHPQSIEGFDQHEKLFADAKLWINEGWVDYWSPQLYWKISTLKQSFPVLMGWWKNENLMNRHFWPGISLDRENNELNTMEVINQIMIIRGMLPYSPGNICWSLSSLLNFKELSDALINGPYKNEALIPATPWFKNQAMEAPKINSEVINDRLKISWTHEESAKVFRWVVYYKYDGRWNYTILENSASSFEIPLVSQNKYYNEDGQEIVTSNKLVEIAVSAIDRISNESVQASQIIK